MNNLTYTYEELIEKSEHISDFSIKFSKEIDYLSDVVKKIGSNLQSEEASMVYQSLESIKSKEELIGKALDNFAISIRDEIAPTYQKIEQQAAKEATDYYGNV